MPMPPNFRELGRSSALAARTSKVDSNGRALLKFDMKLAHFLRMLTEKYFLLANLRTLATHCSVLVAKMRNPQSLEFAASF